MKGDALAPARGVSAGDLSAAAVGSVLVSDTEGKFALSAANGEFAPYVLRTPVKGSVADRPVSAVDIRRSHRVQVLAAGIIPAGAYVRAGAGGKVTAAHASNLADVPANTYVIGKTIESTTGADQLVLIECMGVWAAA